MIKKIDVNGEEFSIGSDSSDIGFDRILLETSWDDSATLRVNFIIEQDMDVSRPIRVNIYKDEELREHELTYQTDSYYSHISIEVSNHLGLMIKSYSTKTDAIHDLSPYVDWAYCGSGYCNLSLIFNSNDDRDVVDDIFEDFFEPYVVASVHFYKSSYLDPVINVEQ